MGWELNPNPLREQVLSIHEANSLAPVKLILIRQAFSNFSRFKVFLKTYIPASIHTGLFCWGLRWTTLYICQCFTYLVRKLVLCYKHMLISDLFKHVLDDHRSICEPERWLTASFLVHTCFPVVQPSWAKNVLKSEVFLLQQLQYFIL